MDLEKRYLAAYGYLRQEILDADKANYQVLGFVLAASGLLFAREGWLSIWPEASGAAQTPGAEPLSEVVGSETERGPRAGA